MVYAAPTRISYLGVSRYAWRKVLSDLKLSKGEERKTCTYGGGPAGCATVIAGVSSTMSYNHV
jgi:hypothetical protein